MRRLLAMVLTLSPEMLLVLWWFVLHVPSARSAIERTMQSLPLWMLLAGTVVYFLARLGRRLAVVLPVTDAQRERAQLVLWWSALAVSPCLLGYVTVGPARVVGIVVVAWFVLLFAHMYETVKEERESAH